MSFNYRIVPSAAADATACLAFLALLSRTRGLDLALAELVTSFESDQKPLRVRLQPHLRGDHEDATLLYGEQPMPSS